LLLSAVLRPRSAAPLLLGARRRRSTSPARTALSSKPAAAAVEWWDRQTDGHSTVSFIVDLLRNPCRQGQ